MEARRRTWFDDRGLVSGERHVPFYAGAMHYWRVAPARWSACLRQIHDLGLTLVETYVPWRVHEPTRGRYDWRGPNDLSRFIELAGTCGLGVVLRPGPHVNAELTSFGIPDHVVGDPQCQAVTARGTPAWMPSPPRAWPVPSYASTAFRARVKAWYAAVAAVIAPAEGPVVALGVDNEAQMFFRLGAFDHDYHPDALAWWREATGHAEPPRVWDEADAARCAAWVRFKDTYLARALGDFAAMLDDVGLGGIARFHNLPPGHHGFYDPRAIQAAIGGPIGIDAYTPRKGLRDLRQRATALVGNATPIPIAFEVGVGFFPWFPPLDQAQPDPTRERDQLLTLLAAGVRGFNLYMAVERDRWYGAAITKDATLEPPAAWIRTLLATLAELDWPALRRATPIAVIDCKADARFGIASSVIDPMTPLLTDALGLGPGGAAELATDRGAITARRWQTQLIAALELAQVPFTIVDESASEDELARFRAVIVPTIERVDRVLWEHLRSLAEAKRTVIVIGPGTPTRDELDAPLGEPGKRMGRIRDGSLDDLPGLAEDLAALAGEVPDAWQIERPDAVRALPYATSDGAVRVVFVVNDADRPATAVMLAGDGATRLRDPFTADQIGVRDGKATIAMPAGGVRLLVVE